MYEDGVVEEEGDTYSGDGGDGVSRMCVQIWGCGARGGDLLWGVMGVLSSMSVCVGRWDCVGGGCNL